MIIDGKLIAKKVKDHLKEQLKSTKNKPGLVFILIGNDPASQTYVKMKKKACEYCGFYSEIIQLDSTISEQELIEKIEKANKNPNIHGILVQQPFPSHISNSHVMQAVDPSKDVDGFHPVNMGKLLLGEEGGFIPCTPLGIIKLLEHEKISTHSKHVVVVGRSNIVGKPVASLLLQKTPFGNATVTVAHSATKDLETLCKRADILIAAMGKPQAITDKHIKKGAIVIDVGINRITVDGKTKIVGDVDIEKVAPLCASFTPVPGGVGPMTIAMLLQNTYQSFCRK